MLYHLIFLSLFSLAVGSCNDSQIFALPVTNVTLSNGQFARGIPVSVGTPAQNLSMMPQPWLNDTWLFNSTYPMCNSSWSTPTGCITSRGGYYNPALSSTRENATDVIAAGADPGDTKRALGMHIWDGVWGTDKLAVGNASLENYPVGMLGMPIYDPYDTQSALGLGVNSTLLSALKKAGAISRRAYSWWWGIQGAATHTEGQIVFGGYDAARVSGPNYTKALNPPTDPGCYSGMTVSVSDMVLTFPNSTQFSMLDGLQLTTCITHDMPGIIGMPWWNTYQKFENLTETSSFSRVGWNGIDFWSVGYWPENVYQGSLTITIDDKISFTFPNELLVKPPSYVASDGSIQSNDSVREVAMDPFMGNTGGTTLGRLFFQVAYLMIDYDANTFTLWNANSTAKDTQLVSGLCEGEKASVSTTSTAGSTASSNATAAHATDAKSSTSSTSQFSTAATSGVAIGGTVILIACIAAAIYFWRRRKAKARANAKPEISKPLPPRPYQEDGYPGIPMMYEVMSRNVNELYGHKDPAEVHGYERPAELGGDWKVLQQQKKKSYWRSETHQSVLKSPVELG